MLPAKTAKLLELKFPFHELYVLPRVVINPLAGGALQLDKIF
jgi:hypothetical protein